VRLQDNTRLVLEDMVLQDATSFGVDVQNTVGAAPEAQPHVTIDGTTIDSIAFAGPNDEGVGLRVAAGPGDGQEVLVRDSTISNCEIQGIAIEGETVLRVESSTISFNGSEVSGGANGAGIGQVDGDLEIASSVIEGNLGNIGGIDFSNGFGLVDLDDVDLIDNQGQNGGGARILSNQAELDRVRALGNSNVGLGGGLTINDGIVTINDSLVMNNEVTGALGKGGGMAINGGEVTLNRVAVTENFAGDVGGGIYKFASDPAFLNNVTLSGNQSESDGAGLYLENGAATLSSVTIAGNIADGDGNSIGEGGGVFVVPSATLTLFQGILSGNGRGSGGATTDDCSGEITSSGYNLVTEVSGCYITGTTTGNVTGVGAGLAPLGWVGGTPLSRGHFLLDSSPALDLGHPSSCPATDQRGEARPFDGDGAGGARCDIGAIESRGEIFFDGLESGDLSGWSTTSR
jgi:hypothetical protein